MLRRTLTSTRCRTRQVTDNVEAVRKLLAEMTADELTEVSGHLVALKQLAPATKRRATDRMSLQAVADETALYEEITRQLRVRYGDPSMPYHVFCKSSFHQHFRKSANIVCAFWESNYDGSVVVRRSLVIRTASLVLDFLEARREFPIWPAICSALNNVALIIDHHFPGYIRSGMIHVMVESMTIQREVNHVRKEPKQTG